MKELGVFILFYIPEAIAGAFVGLSLLGIRPEWRKILTIGALQGFAVFLTRLIYSILEIKVGTHAIFTLLSMIIFIRLVTKIRWGVATAAALLSFVLIAVSEAVMYPMFLSPLGLTIEKVSSSMLLHVVTAYLGDLLLFLTALIVSLTRFTLIRPKN